MFKLCTGYLDAAVSACDDLNAVLGLFALKDHRVVARGQQKQ